MKPSRVRLAVSALLFVGWLGWLTYLAATTTRPVVLSRPQFLAADLYVIAAVRADPADATVPSAEVTIKRVAWSRWAGLADDLKGKEGVVVKNLPLSADRGWKEPGEYILPLTAPQTSGHNYFLVTAIPRSPGYYGPNLDSKLKLLPGRIYPATPTARRELEDLIAEFHKDAR